MAVNVKKIEICGMITIIIDSIMLIEYMYNNYFKF